MSEQDVLREFLIESTENLNRLDSEIIELEQRPADKQLLASVFRTIHTIKGTCGFLGFPLLERIAHQAESLLSLLRSGEETAFGPAGRVILECVDAVRKILASIEATGKEGSDHYEELIESLAAAVARPRSRNPDTAAGNSRARARRKPKRARPCFGIGHPRRRGPARQAHESGRGTGTGPQSGTAIHNAEGRQRLNATAQRLNLITTELQENVMKTRMQPIGVVWNKLPRLVRDTAHACGKHGPSRHGRPGHGIGQDHHRGDQGSAYPPGAELLRPRHRDAPRTACAPANRITGLSP